MFAFARRLAAAVLALAAFAAPALALDTGSPAWLVSDQTLLNGPGAHYDVVGDLAGKTRIRVDRCSNRWCQIHSGGIKGWVSQDHVSFGQEPLHQLVTGPTLDYPQGGPGLVCFFTGTNYSGESVCGPSGLVVPDLLLYGRDNTFSSVQVGEGVSVTACRDRKFKSYCERIIADQPVLNGFLADGVTSYRIW